MPDSMADRSRIFERERFRIRIELRLDADRQHHLFREMADWRAGHTGNPHRLRLALQIDLDPATLLRIVVIEMAEDETGNLSQDSREAQVRKGAVEAVGFLADVIKK